MQWSVSLECPIKKKSNLKKHGENRYACDCITVSDVIVLLGHLQILLWMLKSVLFNGTKNELLKTAHAKILVLLIN